MRAAQQAHDPLCALWFAALDIDRPFAAAGIAPGSVSLVYGVNVLHVARDLGKTPAELRGSFRDALLVPDWRPNGGFLTPEQWTAAREANGFHDVWVYPDIAAIRDAYPSCVIGSILARRP